MATRTVLLWETDGSDPCVWSREEFVALADVHAYATATTHDALPTTWTDAELAVAAAARRDPAIGTARRAGDFYARRGAPDRVGAIQVWRGDDLPAYVCYGAIDKETARRETVAPVDPKVALVPEPAPAQDAPPELPAPTMARVLPLTGVADVYLARYCYEVATGPQGRGYWPADAPSLPFYAGVDPDGGLLISRWKQECRRTAPHTTTELLAEVAKRARTYSPGDQVRKLLDWVVEAANKHPAQIDATTASAVVTVPGMETMPSESAKISAHDRAAWKALPLAVRRELLVIARGGNDCPGPQVADHYLQWCDASGTDVGAMPHGRNHLRAHAAGSAGGFVASREVILALSAEDAAGSSPAQAVAPASVAPPTLVRVKWRELPLGVRQELARYAQTGNACAVDRHPDGHWLRWCLPNASDGKFSTHASDKFTSLAVRELGTLELTTRFVGTRDEVLALAAEDADRAAPAQMVEAALQAAAVPAAPPADPPQETTPAARVNTYERLATLPFRVLERAAWRATPTGHWVGAEPPALTDASVSGWTASGRYPQPITVWRGEESFVVANCGEVIAARDVRRARVDALPRDVLACWAYRASPKDWRDDPPRCPEGWSSRKCYADDDENDAGFVGWVLTSPDGTKVRADDGDILAAWSRLEQREPKLPDAAERDAPHAAEVLDALPYDVVARLAYVASDDGSWPGPVPPVVSGYTLYSLGQQRLRVVGPDLDAAVHAIDVHDAWRRRATDLRLMPFDVLVVASSAESVSDLVYEAWTVQVRGGRVLIRRESDGEAGYHDAAMVQIARDYRAVADAVDDSQLEWLATLPSDVLTHAAWGASEPHALHGALPPAPAAWTIGRPDPHADVTICDGHETFYVPVHVAREAWRRCRTFTFAATRAAIDDAKLLEHHQETTMPEIKPETGILQTLKTDANDAAWRTGGAQFVKLARAPLVGLLARHLGPDDDALRGRLATFLETEIGTALLASLLSVGLGAMPGVAGEVPQRLSRELRVRAMADAGGVVAEVLMGPLRTVMDTYLRDVGPTIGVAAVPAGIGDGECAKGGNVVPLKDPVEATRA